MSGAKKMVQTMLAFVLVFAIAIAAIAITFNLGKPTVDAAKELAEVRNAEAVLKKLDNYIREVAREGNGSVRVYPFTAPESFEVLKGEDAIVFSAEITAPFIELDTRQQRDNLIYIGGNSVSCQERDGNADGTTDLVLENTLIMAVFNRTGTPASHANIDTATSLLLLQEKTNSISVRPVNSSIVIDSNATNSYGTGFSELLRTGSALPFCTAHLFINSTGADYDVYYRLYSGADFLVVEVRNVR